MRNENRNKNRNRNKNKNRVVIPLINIMLILAVSSIAYIWAYYNDQKQVDNTMKTATSEMVMNEIFNESDQWVVGETKQKEVNFENTGEIDQIVRFKIDEQWLEEDSSEEEIPWSEWSSAEDSVVTITYGDGFTTSWTKIDDYYYLNTILEVGEITDNVIESVTFSSGINNGGYNDSLDYSNKQYILTVSMESLEVSSDIAELNWGVNYSENEDGTLTWSVSSVRLILEP